ncbi:MAG: PglZ domain-containing protein [Deltaproteobacteria bacterium]|nr:PglZ domain-containing protein [Deltaproteobacteria bacterium]
MSKILDELRRILEKQLDNAGIVVWYDPEGIYETVAHRLPIEGATFITFDGSYFKVRREIEPLLISVNRARVLVYVKSPRETKLPPLIELEAAGVVCEPGAVTGRNTKLEVLVRAVMKAEGWPAAKIEEEIRNITSGYHNLNDVERLIEQGPIAGTGALALVYGASAGSEIILKFLTNPKADESLIQKNGLPELKELAEISFGVKTSHVSDPHVLRSLLRRHILLTDFRASLPKDVEVDALSAVEMPRKKAHVDACKELASTWRLRSDLSESYADAANRVEGDYHLAQADISVRHLGAVETFSFIEGVLLEHASKLLLNDRPVEALELAESRRGLFWANYIGRNALYWSIITTAGLLLTESERVWNQVKKVKFTVSEMVAAYADGSGVTGSPWCELDYYHRVLEKLYAEIDPGEEADAESLERLLAKCRSVYIQAASDLAERFSDALVSTNFDLASCRLQCDIFKSEVEPYLGKEKVAYFLIDALRYEMARELASILDGKVDLRATVAVAPTLTKVGMAALLPGAEKGLSLIKTSDASVAVEVAGTIVKDRAERIEHLRSRVRQPVHVCKLDDIVRFRKALRQEIEKNNLILVTSQEIDEMCERGEGTLARRFMDEVLRQIKRAIRNLAKCGITRIVITADHGYFFGEAMDSSMKIDPPAGQAIEQHRRVWIGVGVNDHPSYFHFSAGNLGLGGDLEFAFPCSIAAFKVAGPLISYIHEGMALQEMVVPVLIVLPKPRKRELAVDIGYELEISTPRVTTRMFTVRVVYRPAGLFVPETVKVAFRVLKGRKVIGTAATSMYGFQEGTREVILEKEKENYVTVLLEGEELTGKVSVRMLDADTDAELQRIDDIDLCISI